MNLIPEKAYDTGNYWCTWRTQAVVCKNQSLKKVNTASPASAMGEEFLFGELGVLDKISPEIRGDLIVVLDDGWDVPAGIKPVLMLSKVPKADIPHNLGKYANDDYHKYGSFVLDSEKFPSFKGEPKEKLKQLVEKIKSMGFLGTGLWVAVQVPHRCGENPDLNEAKEHWTEKLKWCSYAGIKYLKLDWGLRAHDKEYRKMINDVAKTYAPNVKIETAYTQGVFDVRFDEHNTLEYKERLDEIAFYQQNGDYFRVYDATPQFRCTTIITRTVETFIASKDARQKCHSIPNVEDCLYVGAALGCSIGAMRHFEIEQDEANNYYSPLKTPMTELKRALMWQRISPPFMISESDYEINYEKFTDSYKYPERTDNLWPYVWGKTIVQDVYASMSRNMPLAKVSVPNGEKPVVLCSVNPKTDALSVFSSPRTLDGSVAKSIRADVELKAKKSSAKIGIFGHYNTLKISFEDTVEGKKVYAQDLCSNKASDVTKRVKLCGNSIIIPGNLIDEIGLEIQECEEELPGLVMCIK